MLTQRQENFTLNLYKGQTEHDAWGNAGYSTNYSREVIYVNACRLANSAKVQLRLAELRSYEATSAIADVEERKERLTEIIRDDEPAQNPIQAIAELNKMEHIYEVGGNLRDVNVVFVIGKGYKNLLIEGKDATQ